MSDFLPVLFDAVLASVMESFSPSVNQVFSEYEVDVSSGKKSEADLRGRLEKILTFFPRSHENYGSMIKTLSSFAATDPVSVLTSLCSKFKAETNRSLDNQTVLNLITVLSFDRTNVHHFQFQRYLTLIILSDLISRIFTDYPTRQPIPKLVPCGYNLCQDSKDYPVLQDLLLDTWALIFYHLSGTTFGDIALAFDQYIDDETAPKIFRLISRVQGNQQFGDALLFSVQQMKKKKTLTAEVLDWLAVLLTQLDCDSEVLNEFFKLAWEIRSIKTMKDSAIDLITTLFNRVPTQSKKMQQFFTTRVYKYVNRPDKVERCARAFLRLIRGDISSAYDAYDGKNLLACIGCSGSTAKDQSGPESFTNTFMKVFFPKAPFGKCVTVFRDILLHLASLDIQEFTKNVLPEFLNLGKHGERFLVLLMTLPYINLPEFREKSYCKATVEQINELNGAAKGVIRSLFPILKNVTDKQRSVFILDSYQIQGSADEADQLISDFMQGNNCHVFHPDAAPLNVKCRFGDENDLIYYLLKCIPFVLTEEDMTKLEMMNLVLKFTVNDNQLLSTAAMEIFTLVYHKPSLRKMFIQNCLSLFRLTEVNSETRSRCLQLLYTEILNPKVEFSDELFTEIETTAAILLGSDLPSFRGTALRLLKHLAALGRSSVYSNLCENASVISEAVKRAVLVANVPPRPSMMQLPVGNLPMEIMCISRYNSLWLIAYAEILNVLVDSNDSTLLNNMREFVEPLISAHEALIESDGTSEYALACLYLVYMDSYGPEIQIPEDEEEEFVCDPECCLGPREMVARILNSDSDKVKKAMIRALCFVNWRIIPYVLSMILHADSQLYPDIAWALSFIIQNPANFNHIIREIFREFVEFLSMLQTYFTKLGINSPRDMKWTSSVQQLLRENEALCINYCILISAAFNNIQDQIPEDEWPVSYRQILFQFLIHWAELPDKFDKLKSYSLNALIPIIHAGPVFTNGFAFTLSMLELMLKCQLNGYPMLDALLTYHMDILMNIYVRQVFLKPKRESQLFLDAILAALENCDDASLLLPSAGWLVLLALHCEQDNIDTGKFILTKIVVLLLNQDPEGETVKSLESSEDLSFAPTLCQFATEQVIDAALDILKDCTKLYVVKVLVELLKPWFSMIRLLPTRNFIMQGIPTKYRRFTVISFFDAMFAVSTNLTMELHDAFAELWCQLLQSADNNVVVLVCLFESDQQEAKEKVFSQLLEKDPGLISKYLAKRCTFAYWYFMRTQRKQNVSSLGWMLNVLTRAFIDYVDYAAPSFTVALHFAMLFVEEARELFEATITVFGLDTTESNLIWSREAFNVDLRASSIVSELTEMLAEQRPQAIEKWALEATRWAVGACDITIAYRSLVILNSLHTQIMPTFVQLLVNAVLYHLSRVTDDQCQEVALYIGECFKVLYQHIENADVANFAFPFACAFLHCPAFQENCLAAAMPIFRECVVHPVLGKSAKSVLVDAFLPFTKQLESDQTAQQLLLDITSIVDAPELYMIVSAFLLKPLPFLPVDKTREELMALPLNTEQTTRTFVFFLAMLKTASRPLADSLLYVATELLRKYGRKIERACLVSVFKFALKKISVFPSAVEFIQEIARFDQSIASLQEEAIVSQKNLEDVRKLIVEVLKANAAPEPVPITNCKNVSELQGIIDQKNPPKIYPFATQYEMFLGLKKESSKKLSQMDGGTKRFTSTMSFASGIVISSRSLGISRAMQKVSLEKLELAPLGNKVVHMQFLDLPSEEDGAWKFVVTPQEFVHLDDDEEETSTAAPVENE